MKQLHMWGAASACVLGLITITANAAVMPLEPRLGGLAYYDPNQNITWLADANLAATETFDLPIGASLGTHPSDDSGGEGIINSDDDGTMNWQGGLFWIDAMNAANHLGVNQWRLPSAPQTDTTCSDSSQGIGTGCIASEMGYLFNIIGVSAAAPTPFSNVQAGDYWFGQTVTSDPDSAWEFRFDNGAQSNGLKGHFNSVWAVVDGDVAAVPIPPALWLFGTGLLGLVGVAKSKKSD